MSICLQIKKYIIYRVYYLIASRIILSIFNTKSIYLPFYLNSTISKRKPKDFTPKNKIIKRENALYSNFFSKKYCFQAIVIFLTNFVTFYIIFQWARQTNIKLSHQKTQKSVYLEDQSSKLQVYVKVNINNGEKKVRRAR